MGARWAGLGRGFDASRASWEFPEGTCAGYKGEFEFEVPARNDLSLDSVL